MSMKTGLESRINQESLDLIRSKMNESPDSDFDLTDVSIEEYRRFLILKMESPGVKLAPTEMMDKVWHMHILDTRRYAEDCKTMFGRFLHHNPSYKSIESDENDDALNMAFKNMLSLYSKRFGHDPLDSESGCNTDDDGSACTGVSCCDG